MTTNELLNILYTVPYGKLINGTVDYRVRTFTDVTSNFARVDIDFMRGNTCIGFIRVYKDNTINPALPEILQTNPRHKEYLEAIEKVIAYLELIGFRNDR